MAYSLVQVILRRDKRSKRLPNLTKYLRAVVEKRLTRLVRVSTAIGCGLLGLTSPICATLAWLITGNLGIALVMALVAFPISAGLWYWIDKRLRRAKTPEEAKRMESWRTSNSMLNMEKQRRLHKWLDPTASQILEAGSHHYHRAMTGLSGQYWNSERLPAHWRSVRTQALEAADQAMEELVLMCADCMGEPQADRGQHIQDVLSDLADLDFVDVLGGLKDIAQADWTRYAHRSPNMERIFKPARSIAERLMKLADEIDKKSAEMAEETGPLAVEGEVSESIDVVLSEISALAKAEDELQQRVKD